jgi:hypothetical protein
MSHRWGCLTTETSSYEIADTGMIERALLLPIDHCIRQHACSKSVPIKKALWCGPTKRTATQGLESARG